MTTKVIAIDFDGTIAEYKGFKGKGIFGKPIKGVNFVLNKLKNEGHTLVINTTRLEIHQVGEYLEKHDIPYDYINHNPEDIKRQLHPCKVDADIYIDDKALRFEGDWNKTLLEIREHKLWWRK